MLFLLSKAIRKQASTCPGVLWCPWLVFKRKIPNHFPSAFKKFYPLFQYDYVCIYLPEGEGEKNETMFCRTRVEVLVDLLMFCYS